MLQDPWICMYEWCCIWGFGGREIMLCFKKFCWVREDFPWRLDLLKNDNKKNYWEIGKKKLREEGVAESRGIREGIKHRKHYFHQHLHHSPGSPKWRWFSEMTQMESHWWMKTSMMLLLRIIHYRASLVKTVKWQLHCPVRQRSYRWDSWEVACRYFLSSPPGNLLVN